MIGRFDSTQGRSRALSLAVAAWIALAGSSTTSAQVAKARVKGVVREPAARPALAPGGLETASDPGSAPPPRLADDLPKLDPGVVPAEAEDEKPSLPPARPAPEGAPPASAAGKPPASASEPDPYSIQPDRLGAGRQRVQLSVEIRAASVINLGKESPVKLVVLNESNVDASGVSVVYQLPEGLELVSSTPEATPVPVDKALFHWRKPMLAAGAEWAIVLKVRAKEARSCEHAATVTAKTGSKANATIQEPKLKVEVAAAPGRQLKGGQVTFKITVRNPGTGPARDVIVQAKLSNGLRLGRNDVVQQEIAEIGPGEAVELDPLIVDAIAGGQQTCTVDARSADVNTVAADQKVVRAIEITKPELTVKLAGQEHRFTGQAIEYKLSVSNPGTAPARKVKVAATLPSAGGRLLALPDRAEFDKKTRKLTWSLDQLEPGQAVDMAFTFETGTPGLYKATAEASSGELHPIDTLTSDVSGIAVLDLQIAQTSRVLDVGKTNFYDITIKNVGSKEAVGLQLRGNLTKDKLKLLKPYNIEKGELQSNPATGDFVFPEIERLAVGQSIDLSLEVQALASGPAGCHLFLAHSEMGEEEAKVEDVISTTITGGGRPRAPK